MSQETEMPLDTPRRRLVLAAAASGLAAAAPAVRAQSAAWPGGKPIRILVGFPPGGTSDPYARMLGEHISQKLGVPVIVENRPGASGFIALEALARMPADGHTFGVTTFTSVWGSRALYRKLPFDADKDFISVSMLPVGPLLIAVPTALPVNSVKELLDYAKTRPVAMASYNVGSVPHMVAVEFNTKHGLNINVIQYKGEGPMWLDVASGVVQVGVGSYVAMAPHLQRGTVKVLGSFGMERNPKLPNLRNMVSQGFDAPIFRLDGGLVLLAPAATPADIVRRVGDLCVEAGDSPKGVALREAFAIDARPSTAAEMQRKWREDAPQWIRMTDALGVKID
jgi:tripartite-type tricarboxylate transporter receptor subunit TctC